jgi:drug/metabolite transporter (DMT)-like permease
VTYSLVFGALFLLPLQFIEIPGMGEPGSEVLLTEPTAWVALLGLCLGPTLGSYALFNAGLKTVAASVASVIAMVEPIVAAIAGYLIFGQVLEPPQIFGACLIIAAALSLTLQRPLRQSGESVV